MFKKNLPDTDTTINIRDENVTIINDDSYQKNPIIINNSEVVFFLLGEGFIKENYDQKNSSIKYKEKVLLIRSNNTNLELLGEYINEVNSTVEVNLYLPNKIIDIIYKLFFAKKLQLSAISFELPSIYDDRMVEYTFCWQGKSTLSAKNKIKKILGVYLFNIARDIKNNDIKQIELSLAPILNLCYEINNIHKMENKIKTIFYFMAILIILICSTYYIIKEIHR